MKDLCEGLAGSSVTYLELCNCGITCLTPLKTSLHKTKIKWLDLSSNEFKNLDDAENDLKSCDSINKMEINIKF